MLDEKLRKAIGTELPDSFPLDEHLDKTDINRESTNVTREQLISVIESLAVQGDISLNRPKIYKILDEFGFPKELNEIENDKFRDIFHNRHSRNRKIRSVIESDKEQDISKLEDELGELKQKLKQIDIGDSNSVKELKETVERIEHQSKVIAAPIKIPSPKNMEVKLVSADSLNRLSEYNTDINIFLTLASVFLGSFLGMLGNVLFSSNTSGHAFGVIALLAIVSAVFFMLYSRADSRKKELNKSFMEDDDGVYLGDYEA